MVWQANFGVIYTLFRIYYEKTYLTIKEETTIAIIIVSLSMRELMQSVYIFWSIYNAYTGYRLVYNV